MEGSLHRQGCGWSPEEGFRCPWADKGHKGHMARSMISESYLQFLSLQKLLSCRDTL